MSIRISNLSLALLVALIALVCTADYRKRQQPKPVPPMAKPATPPARPSATTQPHVNARTLRTSEDYMNPIRDAINQAVGNA